MQRALVVSVHDVAPATRSQVEKIVAAIRQLGVKTCSLLVVPNYHRRGVSMEDADFCAWLQSLQEEGSEIVLHGFFHERARQPNESARDKIVTRFYTADEGEFFDLDYAEASRLIRQAQQDFAGRGFQPRGFIPPAWLLSAEAERAAIDAGMVYTTTLRAVRDFAARQEFAARSLVYSVRSAWRRRVSLAWNRALFARLTRSRLLRLSLHPPDIAHPAIWRQIEESITRALRDREAMTYQAWLTRQVFAA